MHVLQCPHAGIIILSTEKGILPHHRRRFNIYNLSCLRTKYVSWKLRGQFKCIMWAYCIHRMSSWVRRWLLCLEAGNQRKMASRTARLGILFPFLEKLLFLYCKILCGLEKTEPWAVIVQKIVMIKGKGGLEINTYRCCWSDSL